MSLFYDKAMTRSILVICSILFVLTSSIYGQAMMGPYWLYDHHYLTDKYVVNPAFAGNQYAPKVFINSQRMEVQLRDAPAVHLAGAHGRLKIGRNHSSPFWTNREARNAVGGLVFADNNGPYQAIGIKFDYAYILPLDRNGATSLSFGLGGMLFSKRIRLDKYSSINDPLIVANIGKKTMVPDLNAGMLFSRHQLFVAFSVSQLMENSYQFSKLNYTPARTFRNYYLLTGYRFLYEKFELEPSVAAGYNLAPGSYSNNGNFVDINIECFLKPVVFTLSYRLNGYIATSLLYRAQRVELGVRTELFSTNISDATFIGVGLTASYTFLSSDAFR